MATEENKEVIFKYLSFENRRENLPVIRIKLIIAGIEYPEKWLNAILDTGYDGGLLIPFDQYREAKLQYTEIPIEDWDIGESVNGRLMLLQAAYSRRKIEGIQKLFGIRIETFQGNESTLLGLNAIKRLLVILDGPMELSKILAE